jgi:hypothetical protein
VNLPDRFQKRRRDQRLHLGSRHYPPENVLFTALPRLCISSPMPRIVAHPSEAKTTKSNAQRSNLFFFIFTSSLPVQSSKHAKTVTAHCLYLITPSLHAIIEGLPLVARASKGGLTLALGQVAVTVLALTLGLVQCWRLLCSAARNEHRGNY